MAEQNMPNDASRKSKAEGERSDVERNTGMDDRRATAGEDAGGITNRPLDEELANQDAVPERGESQPGAHAGHGDDRADDSRRNR
jgi:hypothetical protein